MKLYKAYLGNNTVILTPDKIYADFMNKNLKWYQKLWLFFQ